MSWVILSLFLSFSAVAKGIPLTMMKRESHNRAQTARSLYSRFRQPRTFYKWTIPPCAAAKLWLRPAYQSSLLIARNSEKRGNELGSIRHPFVEGSKWTFTRVTRRVTETVSPGVGESRDVRSLVCTASSDWSIFIVIYNKFHEFRLWLIIPSSTRLSSTGESHTYLHPFLLSISCA